MLIRCEAATEYRRVLAERPDDLIPEVRERLEAGVQTSAVEYLDARRAGDRFAHALRRLLARVDVLALPGRPQTAPKMDENGRLLEPLSPRNYTAPLNYPGVPALTVPCGFDPETLPIGLQLVGRHWAEGTLLAVAHAYQQATDWHRRRPPALRVTGDGGPGATHAVPRVRGTLASFGGSDRGALGGRPSISTRTSSFRAGRSSCSAATRPSSSSSSKMSGRGSSRT